MRAVIRTTIIRDTKGYEVRDYGEPKPGKTLLGGPPSGIHIIGRSGINEKFLISTDQNLRLWEKVRHLNSPQDLADFMSRWGQVSRWLGEDGSRPHSESFLLLEPHIKAIKQLASYVEAGDKVGFCWNLKDRILVERANFIIDTDQPEMPLIIETPSILRFMLLEMWAEFGGERPAHLGIQQCGYCERPFHVGGRRGTKSRRADARYCSDSCRNMASRVRREVR
jgi:hypothetical protein